MDSSRIVNRAALGNSASLGDLYDARRDDFCGISIFKKKIPGTARNIIDSEFSDIHLVTTEDFSEKVLKLDVSAELQVSVLAGMFTLQGSGRYLSDHKTSARSVKSSLVYNIKTKQESVNIYHEDLKEAFSVEAIENGIATHVVVAIEWGANSIVTCQYENKENRDVKELTGNLNAQLEKLKKLSLSASGKADVDYEDGDRSSGVKFDVRMYGDILPKNGELPTTFEGALDLMKRLPSLVATSNDGKGKPLNYRLIPIALLQKYLNFASQSHVVIKSLENTCLVRVVQLFDQMAKAQQQLNDFYQDALEFRYCVPPEDLKRVSDLKNEAQIQETSFKSELCTLLTQIRSGKVDTSNLEELLEKIQKSPISPQKVAEILASWSNVIERINFVRVLVKAGATFIGLGQSLDEEILKNFESKSFILFFSQNAKTDDPERWGGNRQLFFQEMKKKDEGHLYLVVDCDIHPKHLPQNGTSCIQVMQCSQIVVHDLLAEQQKIGLTSYVQGTQAAKLTRDGAPTTRAPLTLACPGKKCNRSRIHDWHCKNCHSIAEYGFDQHLYCKCGKTCAAVLEFKCSDPKHGLSYERHDDEYIQHILNSLQPFGEFNILVIGETPENTIAWLKEFVAFLRYESIEKFEKAKKSSDDQDMLRLQFEPGRKVYLFKIGSTKLRFVVAPEVNCTAEGTEEIKMLLASLPFLRKISAICLLFDPCDPNGNTRFQNYFRQLKSCFGQSARANILFSFCGTAKRTDGAFEQVMLDIEALVWANNETEIVVCNDTVYHIKLQETEKTEETEDLETQFSRDEVDNWKQNSDEAQRMLRYIRQLQPTAMANGLMQNRVESVFNCNLQLDEDRVDEIRFPLSERGLNTGDCISISGYFPHGWKWFGTALGESTDVKLANFFLVIGGKEGSQHLVCIGKAEVELEEEKYVANFSFVDGQPFEIKIICEKDCFQIKINDKDVISYKHSFPSSEINYIFLNTTKFVLTCIEVTRM